MGINSSLMGHLACMQTAYHNNFVRFNGVLAFLLNVFMCSTVFKLMESTTEFFAQKKLSQDFFNLEFVIDTIN